MSCRSIQRDKSWLLIIAAVAVVGLIWIALAALYHSDKVNSESATLIGVIVAGLVAFAKDAVAAVRAFSTDDRMGKMTDQLASAAPVDQSPTPPPANVIKAAQQTADAAQAEADNIEGKKT